LYDELDAFKIGVNYLKTMSNVHVFVIMNIDITPPQKGKNHLNEVID